MIVIPLYGEKDRLVICLKEGKFDLAMKYIDAEKLKAEIERLQKFNSSMSNNAINSNMRNFYDGEEDCCKQLLSFIDSLQQEQPEADLKKEIKEWVDLMVGASFTEQGGDFISEVDYRSVIRQTALHFYELGLNTRKEK